MPSPVLWTANTYLSIWRRKHCSCNKALNTYTYKRWQRYKWKSPPPEYVFVDNEIFIMLCYPKPKKYRHIRGNGLLHFWDIRINLSYMELHVMIWWDESHYLLSISSERRNCSRHVPRHPSSGVITVGITICFWYNTLLAMPRTILIKLVSQSSIDPNSLPIQALPLFSILQQQTNNCTE